jgi:ribosomal protein L37AE/L43A
VIIKTLTRYVCPKCEMPRLIDGRAEGFIVCNGCSERLKITSYNEYLMLEVDVRAVGPQKVGDL